MRRFGPEAGFGPTPRINAAFYRRSVTTSMGPVRAGGRPGAVFASRIPGALRSRQAVLPIATASTGLFLVAMGLLSGVLIAPDLIRDALSGYDAPFDVIAGILLVALSFRVSGQSAVVWFFSLLAPALTIFIALFSPNAFSLAAAAAATMLVAFIFPTRCGAYVGTVSRPESTQLMVVVAALLSLLAGIVGARYLGADFSPPIQGWSEALYFTVATISTNGSQYVPRTDAARDFVVVLILLGVGTFLSAVVVLFQPFLERRLERIAQRLERAQMQGLSDHVIVCGESTTARAAAEAMRGRGVPTVLLVPDGRAVDRLRADGFAATVGEPSSEEDLRTVGIDRARALVAADDSDAENLLTVITARGLEAQLRIVAVATSPANAGKLRRAGANEAISAITVAARLVTIAAIGGDETGGRMAPPAPRK